MKNDKVLIEPLDLGESVIGAYFKAASKGNIELIQFCLKQYAAGIIDIRDDDGNTALIIAAAHGHYEIVKLLFHNDADPNLVNFDGATAFDCAEVHGYDDIKLMLSPSENSQKESEDRSGFDSKSRVDDLVLPILEEKNSNLKPRSKFYQEESIPSNKVGNIPSTAVSATLYERISAKICCVIS